MSLDRPAALACAECRRKHLKCDAKFPTCDRCHAAGKQCTYSPSRRGLKRKVVSSDIATYVQRPSVATGELEASVPPLPELLTPLESSPRSRQLEVPNSDHDEGLVGLFYAKLYPAHPILVPRSMYAEATYPRTLQLVVQSAGSHFSSNTRREDLQRTATEALANAEQYDYHLVQAQLLYAIVLHARGEVAESVHMLDSAVGLALDLRMNDEDYASSQGNGNFVVEESIRRTWWELYVTDGLMAALQRKTTFRCHMVNSSALLPCDEAMYQSGVPPLELSSLRDFDARIYAEEERQFPSSAYRIDAVRILSRVIAVVWTDQVPRERIQAINTAIAAWRLHIPQAHLGHAGIHSDHDEIMFQAQILIHYSSMYLHFPRSDLVSAVPAARDVIREKTLSPTSSQWTHALRAIEAAEQIGHLVVDAPRQSEHTPFLLCYIVFGLIVQLSACAANRPGSHERHWDQISLAIGLLKDLRGTWPLAQAILPKVKHMTAAVFQERPQVAADGLVPEGSVVGGVGRCDDLPFLSEGSISWTDPFLWVGQETL
ncbi:hypothetical protein BJY00DRAFT_122328 [Aspergillus carlsbadensis]|nr:hypothetical protein BJY00DRAFT_122328 [Aspergillus carlsbadensis]